MFYKVDILKNFVRSTGKRLFESLYFIKFHPPPDFVVSDSLVTLNRVPTRVIRCNE